MAKIGAMPTSIGDEATFLAGYTLGTWRLYGRDGPMSIHADFLLRGHTEALGTRRATGAEVVMCVDGITAYW